jgi:pyruvate kinase
MLSKYHPHMPILAICVEGRVARQIEGYMNNARAILTDVKRGDGAHVRLAFAEGKKLGLFVDGDVTVCVHTMRNADDQKQWTLRILNVTSSTAPTPKP